MLVHLSRQHVAPEPGAAVAEAAVAVKDGEVVARLVARDVRLDRVRVLVRLGQLPRVVAALRDDRERARAPVRERELLARLLEHEIL